MKRTIHKPLATVTVTALTLAFSACTAFEERPEPLAPQTEHPSDVQILQLAGENGERYSLPYRAALSPEQAAAALTVTLHDDEGGAMALMPLTSSVVAKSEIPRTGAIELWPIEPTTHKSNSESEEPPDIRVRGATVCEYDENIYHQGHSRDYIVYDAFATGGTVAASNEYADYDLELYRRQNLICSSYRGPAYAEHCMGYAPRLRNVPRWTYTVHRTNDEDGDYHICMDYWWRILH